MIICKSKIQVTFVNRGVSLFNAYTYVQIFVEQEFDCVGGFIRNFSHFLQNLDFFRNVQELLVLEYGRPE